MSMNEVVRYIEAVVVIGCLIYVGAICLDRLASAGLINASGPFNGTATQIAGLWTNSTGMIGTVVIIGAAAIIVSMVMSFRKRGNEGNNGREY